MRETQNLLNAAFKINENNKFNLEAFVSSSKVSAQTAPVPYGALYLSPTSPYFPGNGITPAAVGGLSTDQNGKPGAFGDERLGLEHRVAPPIVSMTYATRPGVPSPLTTAKPASAQARIPPARLAAS